NGCATVHAHAPADHRHGLGRLWNEICLGGAASTLTRGQRALLSTLCRRRPGSPVATRCIALVDPVIDFGRRRTAWPSGENSEGGRLTPHAGNLLRFFSPDPQPSAALRERACPARVAGSKFG